MAESIREQLGRESDVTMSLSDPDLFLYAWTRDAICAAVGIVRDVLTEFRLPHTMRIGFWDPLRETWETVEERALEEAASVGSGVPDDKELARLELEHQDVMRRWQAQLGEANWHVRIELPDHQACKEYARQLNEAGHPAVLHRRYLLLGARSEYEASVLAKMIGQQGPPGSVVKTMPAPYTATTVFKAEMIDAQVAEDAGNLSDLRSETSDLESQIRDLRKAGTAMAGLLDAGSSALQVASDALNSRRDTAGLVEAGITGEAEAPDASVSDLVKNAAALVETNGTRESQVAADVLNLGSDLLKLRKDAAELIKKGDAPEDNAVANNLALESDILQVGSDILALGRDVVKREKK